MIVRSGLVIAWRFAESPTLRSPLSKKPITEGVVRLPSSFVITTGSFPSITDTHELVVPKSIPIILPIIINVLNILCVKIKSDQRKRYGKQHSFNLDFKHFNQSLYHLIKIKNLSELCQF
jgi:hypothetical protein